MLRMRWIDISKSHPNALIEYMHTEARCSAAIQTKPGDLLFKPSQTKQNYNTKDPFICVNVCVCVCMIHTWVILCEKELSNRCICIG